VKFNSGPPAGGNVVQIYGKSFVSVLSVSFGKTVLWDDARTEASSPTSGRPSGGLVGAASLEVDSPDKITVTVPAGTGVVDVRVTTTAGTSAVSSADHYSYVATVPSSPGTTATTAPPRPAPATPTPGSRTVPAGAGQSIAFTGANEEAGGEVAAALALMGCAFVIASRRLRAGKPGGRRRRSSGSR
jgi:hypothetical protein